MISPIDLKGLKTRVAGAAAATAVTTLLLASVSFGFAAPAAAQAAAEAAQRPNPVMGVKAHVPATAAAESSKALIERARLALVERVSADASREHSDATITNLWIYPTGDANAVFVHYVIKTGATGSASSEHLALLEMSARRIANLKDLTAAPDVRVAREDASSKAPVLNATE